MNTEYTQTFHQKTACRAGLCTTVQVSPGELAVGTKTKHCFPVQKEKQTLAPAPDESASGTVWSYMEHLDYRSTPKILIIEDSDRKFCDLGPQWLNWTNYPPQAKFTI